MHKISQLKKIAEGAQAEIYDLEDNKVLRLLRKPEDGILIGYEMKALKSAKESGLDVPVVYEEVNIDGRPGFIMDRISGVSMMDIINKHLFKIYTMTKKMAVLHLKISEIKSPEGIENQKKKSGRLIANNAGLPAGLKGFILKILDGLPEGDSLCHGDFHPGNIFFQDEKSYLIDWCGAGKGDILSDIANTTLIMKTLPRLPFISDMVYKKMKIGSGFAYYNYMRTIRKYHKFNRDLFSKWLLVHAAERMSYCFSSEKEGLLIFLEKCREDYRKKNIGLRWEKFLRPAFSRSSN